MGIAGNPPKRILVSAGEASGEFYLASLVTELRRKWPDAEFYGTAGERLRALGVRDIIRTEDLAVVGLVEVLAHLPRIWGRFRTLIRYAKAHPPDLAILTDSPDFNFRVAGQMKKLGVPVIYLVAPQVWAWRQGRVKTMKKIIDRLLCIFPFEEAWFHKRGVAVHYIGHPLANRVKPALTREEFFRKHNLPPDRPLVAVLPGSRKSESMRHLPELIRAAELLSRKRKLSFLLPASPTTGRDFFAAALKRSQIQAIDGEAWDTIAHSDVALAASGTVTMEAAILGAPMVTFYRVTPVSWAIGKRLVKVPFFSMVNLIAEERIVPELMQDEMTGERLAAEAGMLLDNADEQAKMKKALAVVTARLKTADDPIVTAAKIIHDFWEGRN